MENFASKKLTNDSMQRINGGVVGGGPDNPHTFKYFILIYNKDGIYVGSNYITNDNELAIARKQVAAFGGSLIVTLYTGW